MCKAGSPDGPPRVQGYAYGDGFGQLVSSHANFIPARAVRTQLRICEKYLSFLDKGTSNKTSFSDQTCF
jgi:hypothetical protein